MAELQTARRSPVAENIAEHLGADVRSEVVPSGAPQSAKVSPADTRREVPSKKARLRRVLLLLGPLVVLVGGMYVYLTGGRYVSTDNAYVKMDKLAVASDSSGMVVDIRVKEGEGVNQGQVLFRFDPQPFEIALSAAKAQFGIVRTEIRNLQATYRQNLAQLEQAKSDVTFYDAAYARQLELSKRNIVSQAAFDQAKRDQRSAQQRLVAAQQQVEATLARLGGVAAGVIDDHPRIKHAKAQIEKAERDLARSVVKAPFAGIVTNVSALQIGSYLQPGQAAFSLVGTEHVWIDASMKETDLTFVRPGNTATVTIDTYPGVIWNAKVISVSPASGAEFSVLPAQNASGNWVKVVQRIPVRLEVIAEAKSPPLRAGMSAVVEIDTKHQRGLATILAAR